MNNRDRLRLNNAVYRYFLDRKILNSDLTVGDEMAVSRIRDLALLAWMNHPGFFADGRIENILLERGAAVRVQDANAAVCLPVEQAYASSGKTGILFVATHVYPVGGHTKVIEKLAEGCGDCFQVLALTEHKEDLPVSLRDREEKGALHVLRLSECGGFMTKAASLRRIAARFERILLFTHPNDPIPVLAFSAEDLPPVLFDNHAHFFFSLGMSVSDLVVNHVRYMNTVSEERRFARKTFYFPLRYSRYQYRIGQKVDKTQAKKDIGLEPQVFCMVSIVLGHTVFAGSGERDFFQTVIEIARRYPMAHIYLIGVEKKNTCIGRSAGPESERIHFPGIVPDPLSYYQAADIYLDAFPYPSFGALLEAITYGEACPLLAYGNHDGILSSSNLFDNAIDLKPSDEKDYFRRLDLYVRSEQTRREIVQRLKAEQIFCESAFSSHLNNLAAVSATLRHRSVAVPDGRAEEREDDLALAGMSQLKSYGAMLEKMRGTTLLGRRLFRGYLWDRLVILSLFLRNNRSLAARLDVLMDAAMAMVRFVRRRLRVAFGSREPRGVGPDGFGEKATR